MEDIRPIRKLVTVPSDVARRVDDYRFGRRIGSESEAIRRLISIGLEHTEEPSRTPSEN
jgi:hypothetical protein